MNAKYQCPLCRQPLNLAEQGFGCVNNHQFDRAKEGYVNLLPVQNKSSKVPGDSKQMVLARRDFLATGAYDFLRQAVVNTLKAHLDNSATIIDVGCGEGYYTQLLGEHFDQGQVYGVDIAKPAVRYAAKRSNTVHYCVASNIALPFNEGLSDLLCKIFAPVDTKEVARVLKPKGFYLTVVPGPKHLYELKQVIYESVKLHEMEVCPDGFELLSTESLTKTQSLTKATDIANLCQMTPFAWKISESKKQQLISQKNLSVTFDFVVNLYQKRLKLTPHS